MDINSAVDAFVKRHPTHIDEDGYYGAQCWDVVAAYAREVFNCTPFPTGSGGAEGLYRLFQDPIPQFFDRVKGNYKKGDIIVWTKEWSPPYGHTALCLGFDGTTLTVFEQNGNNPGGDPYTIKRSLNGVSGALRPKGNTMNKEQAAELALYIRLLAFESVDEANSHSSDDVSHILADPGYAGAIAKTVYKGEWQVPAWKAGNFDGVAAKIPVLTTQVDELVKVQSIKDGVIEGQKKEIESLKAQTGDNTKWETLKALIRELVKG